MDTAFTMILLALLGVALGVGLVFLGWRLAGRRMGPTRQTSGPSPPLASKSAKAPPRPCCWVAIRAVSTESVKEALALNRAKPCSWTDGLTGDHEFFISPQLNGWIIVTGMGLPNPTDDVDATFLFLTALSRKLGHVQYFYASRLLHHHSWARLDEGCVTRAYAWAGETVWNQGIETLPEIETGLKTFPYGDPTGTTLDAEANFEKVPRLATRWSLDPATVKVNPTRQFTGLAGESAWS